MLNMDEFSKIDFSRKKIAIISHNDDDGAGPIIIVDHLFKDYKYFTVSNNAVDKVVKLVLFSQEYKDIQVIFITDVSIVSTELAHTITKINRESKKKIYLFDHHGTALWLNQFDWAVVTDEKGVSGTKLFFNYMEKFITESLPIFEWNFLMELSDVISDWDTWQWVEKGITEPRDHAVLFTKTGINYFLTKYKNEHEVFNDYDRALLRDFADKEKYLIIPGILKTAAIIDINFTYSYEEMTPKEELAFGEFPYIRITQVNTTKRVKCVSVAEAPNDLAEKLYEDGVDFVMMFYSNGTVSVRTRSNEVNLGAWAKYIASGGGHPRSAGFTLTKETFWIYQDYLNARYELD
jgi:oligoribonuclease NrnB/cAMP/cGMP phosphodiesterase (DHH superfamily)